MATAGAPVGNRNATKNKEWADVLRRLSMRPVADPKNPGKERKRLEKIAETVLRLAEEGDMQAIKEIGDRLDGKPAQSVDLGGDLGFSVTIASEDSALL